MASTLQDFQGWKIIRTDQNGKVIEEDTRRRRRRGHLDDKEVVTLQRSSDGLKLHCGKSVMCSNTSTQSFDVYMIHEIRLNTTNNYVELWCFNYLRWYEINPLKYYQQFEPSLILKEHDDEYYAEKFTSECDKSEIYLTAELSEIYLRDLINIAVIHDSAEYLDSVQNHDKNKFLVTKVCEPDGSLFSPINIHEFESNIIKWEPKVSVKYLHELMVTGSIVSKQKQPKSVNKPSKGSKLIAKETLDNTSNHISKDEKIIVEKMGTSNINLNKINDELGVVPSEFTKDHLYGNQNLQHVQSKNVSNIDSVHIEPSIDIKGKRKKNDNGVSEESEDDSYFQDAREMPHVGFDTYLSNTVDNGDTPFIPSDEDQHSDVKQLSEGISTEDDSIDEIYTGSKSTRKKIPKIEVTTPIFKKNKNNTELTSKKQTTNNQVVGISTLKKYKKKNVTRAKKGYTPFSKKYKRSEDIPDLRTLSQFHNDNGDIDVAAIENKFRSPTKQHIAETIFSKVKKQLNSSHGKDEIVKSTNFDEYLPARENEFATIYLSIYSAIEAGTGTSLYIAGTPGVGKTLTVREVIKELLTSADQKELPKFQYIEINGLKMVKSTDSYEVLWHRISGERLTSGAAMESLEFYFNTVPKMKKRPVVVLLDELDALVTKHQDVMYNFFNWTTYENSKFVVIAIANTMDLPERQLGSKVSSRIGFTRIMFTGYTHDELKTIINLRLNGFNNSYFYVDPRNGSAYIFSEDEELPADIGSMQKVKLKISDDAVEIASRKIASVSGDARRALKVCKRAVEIAERDYMDKNNFNYEGTNKPTNITDQVNLEEQIQTVEISHITRALNETISSPIGTFLSRLSFTAKLFLYAFINLTKKNNTQEVLLGDIIDEIELLLNVNGKNKYILEMKQVLFLDEGGDIGGQLRIISWDYLVNQLIEAGLIIKQNLKNERMCALKLNLSIEDISRTILEDEIMREL